MPKKSNKVRADGYIAVSVYLGIVDGKRKYKTVYGKTQKEADKKARELKSRMGLGVDILSENTPFRVYREMWLADKKRAVSESYYRVYEGYSNSLKVFDNYEIRKLQKHHVQAFLDEMAKINPHTKKPTAKKTLSNYRYAVEHMLQIAVEQGAVVKNIAKDVEVACTAPQTKREALSDEQIKWIEETPHRAQTAAMIMLYSGLRRGELLALTWGDINLAEGTISVNKAVEMIGTHPNVKNHTKTNAGMRIIYIPRKLSDYLSHIKRKSILVVPDTAGGLMAEHNWQKLWRSYMCDLNVKYGKRTGKVSKYSPKSDNPMIINAFTAHQLRHTFASMLYKSGVDVLSAKEQLGHADIQTTLSIYTHLDAKFKKKSMDKLDEYLKCPENASITQV